MIRIDTPAWARAYELNVDPSFNAIEYIKVAAKRDLILSTVQQAVQNYIDGITRTSQAFPELERISGQFYIQGENYWVIDEPWFAKVERRAEHRFSVMVHCLEHPRQDTEPNLDYLGLEIKFRWDVETESIQSDLAVDVSSI